MHMHIHMYIDHICDSGSHQLWQLPVAPTLCRLPTSQRTNQAAGMFSHRQLPNFAYIIVETSMNHYASILVYVKLIYIYIFIYQIFIYIFNLYIYIYIYIYIKYLYIYNIYYIYYIYYIYIIYIQWKYMFVLRIDQSVSQLCLFACVKNLKLHSAVMSFIHANLIAHGGAG